ncbi:hypothetical protein SAMN04487907_11143 [Zunongwangia mangrovi]|uniref:HipA-like kinase domain-containing protein n=1 Tax=Zunongwangia mangrovi TaxID=1334022 RepID=A0A1I1N198_9FLAO|nr:HipA family kinase [Zunongwangia mangrovi]SFC88613.1 hypothetical protein SAMN04487907_11143 [Zunongwangia mangrovi]
MIEELKFVGIHSRLKGGSTKPLVIEAEDQSQRINSYVLKLYKNDYVTDYFTIAKEIIISELAEQFNLPVPKYGVIDLDNELLLEEYDPDFIRELNSGYKFCNYYHEGTLLYNDSLRSKFLENYDIENVFAFDNLILNTDRGGFRNKPNLLITDDNFLLIDHEQTFQFFDIRSAGRETDYKLKFNSYYFNNHIFLKLLRKLKSKEYVFDEFDENLRTLNLNFLDDLFRDFRKFNIDCGEKSAIFAYLNWCKINRSYITKSLKDRIL